MGFVPITISAGQNPLVQCDGKIKTHFLQPPAGTSFQILQKYQPLPKGDTSDAYRGPPPHFHAHQTERFRVIKGRIDVEINEEIKILRPGDDVAVCPAGNIHRFFVDVGEHENIFMVNATDSGKDFYYKNKIDFIQQCATFDGGDHYLPFPATLPKWVPKPWSVWIRTLLGYWITVLIGRWIGGLLGYQPFYRDTWFYRKNVQTAYRAASSWPKIQKMEVWSDEGAENMGIDKIFKKCIVCDGCVASSTTSRK
ncbi:uncharacterized protein P884DRAFT_277391 [Thermothelomyces heterothallicus CBS 202.75]|uniref:uncharacterized protein n=1 Tax=Thermothelomyces heterothallicus CBS 202.75 TaxID=1149848 RepID=UPI0037445D3A